MMTETEILELRPVLQAQHSLLRRLGARLDEVEVEFADLGAQKEALADLGRLMDELERDAELVLAEDLEDFSPETIERLYLKRQRAVDSDLARIGFQDWPSFVKACQVHCLEKGANPLAPYEHLLTEADLARLRDESYGAQYRWDRLDYIFVGAAGVLAVLTDFLLVRLPKTMLPFSEYSGQSGSPVTAWLRGLTDREKGGFRQWCADAGTRLEKEYRVSYDRIAPGLGGRTHRLQTLGHDPVLGFVFGVWDIMHGTMTGFRYDGQVASLFQDPAAEGGVKLAEALLRHIGHLFSDVGTAQGLPAPFMTLLQGLNVGNFGEKHRTLGQVARWMYLNGYDLRHFLVSGITPATVEIILRGYLMLRHYSEHGEVKLQLGNHPKYRTMLLVAHAVAASANAGRVALLHGNPLAVNYPQWLALFRYLAPSLKYWVLDQHRLEIEHLQNLTDSGWDELLAQSRELLTRIPSSAPEPFELRPETNHPQASRGMP